MLLPVPVMAKDEPPEGIFPKMPVFASLSVLLFTTAGSVTEVVTDEEIAVDGLAGEPNWKTGAPADPKRLLLEVPELHVAVAKFVVLADDDELVPAAGV